MMVRGRYTTSSPYRGIPQTEAAFRIRTVIETYDYHTEFYAADIKQKLPHIDLAHIRHYLISEVRAGRLVATGGRSREHWKYLRVPPVTVRQIQKDT